MRRRARQIPIFVSAAVLLVCVLQVMILRQSLRVGRGLESFVTELEAAVASSAAGGVSQATGDYYPGDAGDWRIWAYNVEPKTLNLISADSDIYSRWAMIRWVFEPLLVYNYETVQMEPLLAREYSISDDGLVYTFTLRDDARFSDGVPVTADDVLFTYRTIVDPGVDAANIANYYMDVQRAEKVTDRKVRFVMKRPYFKALENLAFWDVGILPKHIYEYNDPAEFNARVSNPVGSGPYVFEKWVKGERIVLARNENYWGPKPKIDKIVYRFVVNEQAAVEALRTGEVDMIIPTPEQYAVLEHDPEINARFYCMAFWNPGAPFYYIGWNFDTPFFADPRVRLAMTSMIDRREIIDSLLGGNAAEITGPFFIKGKQNDPSIEPWPYNPARAAQLLDDAGWMDTDGDGVRDKNGTAFRFKFAYTSNNLIYQKLVKLLKDRAAQLGIEIEPDPIEWSVLVVRVKDRLFEAMVMGWGGDILEDPYQLWHSSQIGDGGSNYVGFSDPEADRIIEEARSILDEDRRNTLYHRLHRILHDQQPYTFLYARPTLRIVDRRFHNVNSYTLGPNYMEWFVPRELQKY